MPCNNCELEQRSGRSSPMVARNVLGSKSRLFMPDLEGPKRDWVQHPIPLGSHPRTRSVSSESAALCHWQHFVIDGVGEFSSLSRLGGEFNSPCKHGHTPSCASDRKARSKAARESARRVSHGKRKLYPTQVRESAWNCCLFQFHEQQNEDRPHSNGYRQLNQLCVS